MKVFVSSSMLVILASMLVAQDNCRAHRYFGDVLKERACLLCEERRGHSQLSMKYQKALDRSLAIDATYAPAYYYKSTAYLKTGDMVAWKNIIDKAVESNPREYLGHRGWCRMRFFGDYSGALEDFNALRDLAGEDHMGMAVSGDYSLEVGMAISYGKIGKPKAGIEVLEDWISRSGHLAGMFDLIHLGVLFLSIGDVESAVRVLTHQEKILDIAENRYYKAKAYLLGGMTQQALREMEICKTLFGSDVKMRDAYISPMDHISSRDIVSLYTNIIETRPNLNSVQKSR